MKSISSITIVPPGRSALHILASAAEHLEYTTAADIKEAQRLAGTGQPGFRYFNLAIRGLAATHQQQEAFALAAAQETVMSTVAFAELTRAMVKAGAPDSASLALMAELARSERSALKRRPAARWQPRDRRYGVHCA